MGEGVVQSQLVVSRTLVTCQDCQDCTFTPLMCNCEIWYCVTCKNALGSLFWMSGIYARSLHQHLLTYIFSFIMFRWCHFFPWRYCRAKVRAVMEWGRVRNKKTIIRGRRAEVEVRSYTGQKMCCSMGSAVCQPRETCSQYTSCARKLNRCFIWWWACCDCGEITLFISLYHVK